MLSDTNYKQDNTKGRGGREAVAKDAKQEHFGKRDKNSYTKLNRTAARPPAGVHRSAVQYVHAELHFPDILLLSTFKFLPHSSSAPRLAKPHFA